MTGNRMTVHSIAGKRFTRAWIDEEGEVQIDMEDARPKLLTPEQRAAATEADCVAEPYALLVRGFVTQGVAADRDDILAKVAHRFTAGPSRATDPLGQRYIHYDDLADLLKP